MSHVPQLLLPAPLPRRAWVIGCVAGALWLLALAALGRDLWLGNNPWSAHGFVAGLGSCLLWALADAPVRYELDGRTLTIVTRLRRVSLPRGSIRFVGRLEKDRFAIDGGFGWYGWFHSEGRIVRAWVTDPRATWVMEGERAVAFSPSDRVALDADQGRCATARHRGSP